MGKLVFVLLAVIAAVLWFRYKTGGSARRVQPKPAPAVEKMVACAVCGVHLPATSAVQDSAGRLYCGKQHLDAAADKP